MQKVCPRCKQVSSDGNLWCQEIDCPAGRLSSLLIYGSTLGSFQVIRLLRNWPSAALYHVQQGKTPFLLKVANPGFEKQIQAEAALWQAIVPTADPALPVWMPHGADNTADAFGITSFRGRTLYYIVFRYCSGQFLTDYLLDNPQPWHHHTGWFMLALGRGLSQIDDAGWLALNLTPEAILVVPNKAGVPQPVLLDPGLLANKNDGKMAAGSPAQVQSALIAEYTAPEVIAPNPLLSERSEVYNLGLILYEMLTGHPALTAHLSAYPSDQERESLFGLIRMDIERRPDLPKTPQSLGSVLTKALDRSPGKRFGSPAEFTQALADMYGAIPNRRRPLELSRGQSVAVIIGLLLVVLLIVAMLVLSGVSLGKI